MTTAAAVTLWLSAIAVTCLVTGTARIAYLLGRAHATRKDPS